jgi:hypothetical protein
MSNTNTQRTELAAQLSKAETELAALETELATLNARRNQDNGLFIGAAPGRHSDLLRLIPDAESRVESLRERLAEFDKAENYRRQVAEAPKKAAQAFKAWGETSQRIEALETSAAILRERIALAQSENSTAVDSVASAETDAAREYAKSIHSGDRKAESAALEVLKKAQVASARAKATAASNAFVIGALQAELTALEEQAQAARNEASEYRRMTFEQLAISLRAKWDAKANELVSLGAKLLAASSRADLADGLSDLRIPVFSTDAYIYRDLIGMEEDVTDDSLVAEIGGSK